MLRLLGKNAGALSNLGAVTSALPATASHTSAAASSSSPAPPSGERPEPRTGGPGAGTVPLNYRLKDAARGDQRRDITMMAMHGDPQDPAAREKFIAQAKTARASGAIPEGELVIAQSFQGAEELGGKRLDYDPENHIAFDGQKRDRTEPTSQNEVLHDAKSLLKGGETDRIRTDKFDYPRGETGHGAAELVKDAMATNNAEVSEFPEEYTGDHIFQMALNHGTTYEPNIHMGLKAAEDLLTKEMTSRKTYEGDFFALGHGEHAGQQENLKTMHVIEIANNAVPERSRSA